MNSLNDKNLETGRETGRKQHLQPETHSVLSEGEENNTCMPHLASPQDVIPH